MRALLEKCVSNNPPRDVTGVLLYKDGDFMQVLKGKEKMVRAVHGIIAADPRHRGLMTLLQGAMPGRQFPGWSMGFQDLGSDLDSPEGYSEFLNFPLTDAEFTSGPTLKTRDNWLIGLMQEKYAEPMTVSVAAASAMQAVRQDAE